jgi:DNA mismatch repair protein MutL
VNVHPTKQEIKFDDEKLVYNYLKVAVRHALGTHSVTPTIDFDQENSFANSSTNVNNTGPIEEPQVFGNQFIEQSEKRMTVEDFINPGGRVSGANSSGGTNIKSPFSGNNDRKNLENWQKLYDGLDLFDKKKEGVEQESEDVETILAAQPAEDFRQSLDETNDLVESVTIASRWENEPSQLDDEGGNFSKASKQPYQIHGQYIVSQIKSGFLLIDQQYASERILFEKYLTALEGQPIGTQQALFPKNIHFSANDARVLREILPAINQLGFEIAEFGRDTFIVHGVPADLATGQDEQHLIEKLLQQFKENLALNVGSRENIARSMARSAALKRGQLLTQPEMKELIDQLFACEGLFSSPSGKPTFITFDLDDIKKRFINGH